ncbi:hypothetical protein BN7_5560 [Wickerhamomyces ciferrii]|uniref:Uncharacterized protein n=1 Tax=Wickerhamomyces ciferrii (strain ATCC 14091 / BCRC 22168 / CBS 111 / JCM 3599 / NBRC 0793 / NRRL Y-1031 F-60-10) TaxID=1206466 RepID=K0KY06_WICCF|nr:uncharacterized protein BN7_5560 [Wickerhamomyces ciferrii]CCH45973.1 hypothetical protein BN7_5560 [Wickerhamomyces ciferrii]
MNISEAPIYSPSPSDQLNPKFDNVFPMEIWDLIANYGDLKSSTMLMVNKTFMQTFASKLYDTLQLTIVISTLTKMKLNDKSFLKYGFDKKEVLPGLKSQVEARHKYNKNYDYEYLETEILRDRWVDYYVNCSNFNEEQHKHPKPTKFLERKNKPEEIKSIYKIKYIMKNVFHNPQSKMKQFIKEVLIDVCVLDEMDKLLSDSNDLSKLIKENYSNPSSNEKISILRTSCKNPVVPLDDNFEKRRWEDQDETNERYQVFADKVLFSLRRSKILDLFPRDVYFKELSTVHLLSREMYSSQLRRRLFNLTDENTFNKANPVRYWCDRLLYYLNHTANPLNLDPLYTLIINAQIRVDIKHRQVETKAGINKFLSELIQPFTTPGQHLQF